LLIRHSTVIENDVAESEICSQLVDVLMRDKNDKVRRKAVAALGEFMFYAATQLDDEQADRCWDIRDESINAIIKSLKVETSPQGEVSDETVVFYAVKTLENITAQSNSAGGRFATVESANYLLQIFLGLHT
jgi:serine/threonine-protein kinase ULK4